MQGMPRGRVASLRNLKLITLDVTGTLLKFRKPPVQQYIEVGLKHRVKVDKEQMEEAFDGCWQYMNYTQPHFGKCYKAWWTEFVTKTFNACTPAGYTPKSFDSIAAELIQLFKTTECWEVREGAVEFLSFLDSFRANANVENGPKLQIGVISNFDSRLEDILRATELRKFFDFVITSHEIQMSKPDPGIFKLALKTACDINTERDPWSDPIISVQALHIGDKHDKDYEGARNAGWNSFLVMSPQEYAANMNRLPHNIRFAVPPVIFADFLDLKGYFEAASYVQRG